MNIIQATSPIYSKADNSTIDCMVEFDNGKTYPYTAAAYDNTDYGIQLWTDLKSGKYGRVADYIVPTTSTPQE